MATMTIYFDDPFWVAVLEVPTAGRVRAVRHVFGAEPTNAELYQFLLRHGVALFARAERSTAVPDDRSALTPARNPKRLAREAARAAREPRPSTMAQQAIKADLEGRARAAQRRSHEQREEQAEYRRQVRREKSRARHRGH